MRRLSLFVVLAACSSATTSLEDRPVVLRHPEGLSMVAWPEVLQAPLLSGPDASRFIFEDGQLRFRRPPDFENPDDADANGRYDWIVESAGRARVAQLVLEDVDEPPVWRVRSVYEVPEGQRIVAVGRLAEDPEGTSVTLEVVGGPDAAGFTVRPDFAFVDAPDFERPTDANGDNRYEVTLAARDGTLEAAATQSFEVTVVDRNDGVPRVDFRLIHPMHGARGSVQSLTVDYELSGVSGVPVSVDGGPNMMRDAGRWTNEVEAGPPTAARAVSVDILFETAGGISGGLSASATVDTRPFVLRSPVAVAGTEDGRVWVLDGAGEVYAWSTDRNTWASAPVPGTSVDIAALSPDHALLLTDAGLLEARLLGDSVTVRPWSEFRPRAPTAIEASSDTEAYVVDDGALWSVPAVGTATTVGRTDLGYRDVTLGRGSPYLLAPAGRSATIYRIGSGGPVAWASVLAPVDEGARLVYSEGAPGSQDELRVLSRGTLWRFASDGRERGSMLITDPTGARLGRARLGRGLSAGRPMIAQAFPPLVSIIDLDAGTAVGRGLDGVGRGASFPAIEGLLATEDGLDVLHRGGLGRLIFERLLRERTDIVLGGPAAFAVNADRTTTYIADRSLEAPLSVSLAGRVRTLPSPEIDTGVPLRGPVAIGHHMETDTLWVLGSAPPQLFSRTGNEPWQARVFSTVAVVAAFDFPRQVVWTENGRGRVEGHDLAEPATLVLSAAGPSWDTASDIAVAGGQIFVLDGPSGAVLSIDLDTQARRRVSGPERGEGPSLAGGVALAVDGFGRIFVGRSDGAILVVTPHSGDRSVISF